MKEWIVIEDWTAISTHRTPQAAAQAIVAAGEQGRWHIALRNGSGCYRLRASTEREELEMAEISHGRQEILPDVAA